MSSNYNHGKILHYHYALTQLQSWHGFALPKSSKQLQSWQWFCIYHAFADTFMTMVLNCHGTFFILHCHKAFSLLQWRCMTKHLRADTVNSVKGGTEGQLCIGEWCAAAVGLHCHHTFVRLQPDCIATKLVCTDTGFLSGCSGLNV